MATETRTITVCDKCCELLEHNTSSEGELVEIRVEPCPECSQAGLKLSDTQLGLVLRVIRSAKFVVCTSADQNDLIEIENKIEELKEN